MPAFEDLPVAIQYYIRDASGAASEKVVWTSQRDQPRVLGWTPDAKNLIILRGRRVVRAR